ncbi:MoaD/ThiS family protein [Georgenia halophila]|uniref:MoaD/ThiS family protein n=1 Tax=Georgenia halophila TaxID=620889 RepID=A0ABP8L184_9MICO
MTARAEDTMDAGNTTTADGDSTAGGAAVVRLRYFAAAAEAAGSPGEDLTLPAGSTVADLITALTDAHGPKLGRVLTISSLLVDGVTTVVAENGDATLTSGSEVQVDVLPPFAGG